jgi:hypothetical protein
MFIFFDELSVKLQPYQPQAQFSAATTVRRDSSGVPPRWPPPTTIEIPKFPKINPKLLFF